MDTAKKHQKNIAYKTLRMTPQMALIIGGMTFEEAYELIFKIDLKERLNDLIEEYGQGDLFSWELKYYGHNSPYELLMSL